MRNGLASKAKTPTSVLFWLSFCAKRQPKQKQRANGNGRQPASQLDALRHTASQLGSQRAFIVYSSRWLLPSFVGLRSPVCLFACSPYRLFACSPARLCLPVRQSACLSCSPAPLAVGSVDSSELSEPYEFRHSNAPRLRADTRPSGDSKAARWPTSPNCWASELGGQLARLPPPRLTPLGWRSIGLRPSSVEAPQPQPQLQR